jgi:hypothetical protein
MYAAFDPSFKSRATPADIALNSVENVRTTVLRIIGADTLVTKPNPALATPLGRKRKVGKLSSDMIRIGESDANSTLTASDHYELSSTEYSR